jgi:hypothetical protein
MKPRPPTEPRCHVLTINQDWYLEYKKYHSFNNTVMPGDIKDGFYSWQDRYYYLTGDELRQVKEDTEAYINHRDVSRNGLVYNGRRSGKKFRCHFSKVGAAQHLYEQIVFMEHNRFGKMYGRLAELINQDTRGADSNHRRFLMLPQNMVQLMEDAFWDASGDEEVIHVRVGM